MLCGINDERAPGGFHYVSDGAEAVDLQNTLDLDKQALDQAKVAARDPYDYGDRMGVGKNRLGRARVRASGA